LKDARVAKVERLLYELGDIGSDMKEIVGQCGDDLPTSVDRQVERSRDILARLNELKENKLRSSHFSRSIWRDGGQINHVAERTNLWVDIAEKIHRYWPLLLGLMHHS